MVTTINSFLNGNVGLFFGTTDTSSSGGLLGVLSGGTATDSASSIVSLDASVLSNALLSKSGGASGSSGSADAKALLAQTQANKAAPTGTTNAPTAPWAPNAKAKTTDQLVQAALAGHDVIDPSGYKIDLPKSSGDYNKLFTLFQAVNTLDALSKKVQNTKNTSTENAGYQAAFARGLTEVDTFIRSSKLDHLNFVEGQVTSFDKTTVNVAYTEASYTGLNITTGDQNGAIDSLAGPVKFSITAQKIGHALPIQVNFDLSEMGTQTRSISNVTAYMNSKLSAAGLSTRMKVNSTVTPAQTTKVNGQTVTTTAAQTNYGLAIAGDATETLTLSAPDTSDSVFVAQTTGKETTKSTVNKDGTTTKTTTNDFTRQLLKFQTDVSASGVGAPAATHTAGLITPSPAETEQTKLDPAIGAVHATQASPDGGVYVLADVTDKINGQTIKGSQDVALIKYDSAGQVVYTRTLGASSQASGLSLAVSADGHVAVAGSVTGKLTGTTPGSTSGVDSFVTLYDASGVEQWTKRPGATAEDEATSLSFDASNNLYVGGQTKSLAPGAATTQGGGFDSFLTSFSVAGATLSTLQSGTGADDKSLASTVNGTTLYSVTAQGTDTIVTSYDISSQPPTQIASRSLGGLGGGSVSQIVVQNGKLLIGGVTGNSGFLGGAQVTSAASGGTDAFAASLNTDLTQTGIDKIAFFGGAGNETAKVTFSNGKAYIAGQTDGAIAGTNQIGAKDGYVARVNIDTGATEWSQRYTGADAVVDPNAIAVVKGGSSVLDKLGLPKGTLLYDDSRTLESNTSVRAGDQFSIRDPRSLQSTTLTIASGETLKTLADKIQKASGFALTVTVSQFNGKSSLNLTPANGNAASELIEGPAGKDALAALGLNPGLIKTIPITPPTNQDPHKVKKDISLNFDPNLSLDTPDAQTKALSSLEHTLTAIRSAYSYLRFGNPPTSNAGSASSSVPAYLTNQISNYQAALQRLTGGA